MIDTNHPTQALEQLEGAVAAIRRALGNASGEDRDGFADRITRAAELLCGDAGHPPRSSLDVRAPVARVIRGGLAAWQMRKLQLFIDAHLDSTVSVKTLAAFTGLSECHFSRTFSKSFGESPHAFIMRKRVARAKELMLTSPSSLGQIAADCGLADQAHLTKLFSRYTGESPGAWRRARRESVTASRARLR